MREQINISVVRFEKKKPTWGVRVTGNTPGGFPISVLLPGELQYRDAVSVANSLAVGYRNSRYNVALDTKTCNRRRRVPASSQGFVSAT